MNCRSVHGSKETTMSEYQEYDLIETLTELGLEYKQRGKELELFKCPFCEQSRTKKSDHFSFRRDTGQFKCIKCEERGNLVIFRRMMGMEPFLHKTYQQLNQKKVKEYKNQPDNFYTRYSEIRGISVETLKKYGVGQFKDGKLGSCRTYQYVDTDGKIVNVKYVNKDKRMRTESNAKKIYYGLQFVDFEKDYLHIVEGEDDVHAMIDMQVDNVVSIPYGAGSYSPEMGKINAKFKTLYLLFDNDSKGQEGAEKFSHKAGVWKCKNVHLPFKDARECLLNGIDLFGIERYKNKSNQFEYSIEDKLRPALSVEERWSRYYSSLNVGGLMFQYNLFDAVIGGLRPGEVMSVVANPGVYKTTLLMNLIIKMASKLTEGFILFFSLEMAVENEFERELGIISGKTRSYFKQNMENRFVTDTIKNAALKELNRIYVSDESFINLGQMIKIIERTEEVVGEKCLMVACDYSDFVDGEKAGKEYEIIKEVAGGFKSRICRGLGVAGIMLYQTNRDNKKPTDEVYARSGKGGTPIEAGSDFQLGLWRNNGIVGRFTKHRRLNDNWNGQPWPYFKLAIPDVKTYKIANIYEIARPNQEESQF